MQLTWPILIAQLAQVAAGRRQGSGCSGGAESGFLQGDGTNAGDASRPARMAGQYKGKV
jgi:hypothetical protein